MTRWPDRLRRGLAVLIAALAVAVTIPAVSLAETTATFGPDDSATYPGKLKTAGKAIEVDLTALGKAKVHRAVLRLVQQNVSRNFGPVRVTAAGKALALLGPRYRSFDATAAVRDAIQAGGALKIAVESLPGWVPAKTRLEVTFAGKTAAKLPAVKHLKAWHRNGQTFLTFQEVDPPIQAKKVTIGELRDARKKLAAGKEIAYRIYRAAKPITAKTIAQAERVDQIGQTTCWNGEYYGVYPNKDAPALRYAVEDPDGAGGKGPVPPGTGIYVHNPAKAGRAYYAVVAAVNGQEDLDAFTADNTAGPIDEKAGPGDLVLQRIVKPKSFVYVANPTLYYYVRWEAPPRSNLPSRPFDYLVAVPPNVRKPAPCGIHFHCWGANLNGGFGWWYNGRRGAILISSNQIPYDWWTGYHEALGTMKSWADGVVRSYSIHRIRAFYEWVATNYDVDRTRVFAAGSSMGGAGSLMFAARNSDLIAWTSSWVGVHVPAKTPQFRGSYAGCFGPLKLKFKHASGRNVWDYFSDVWYLKAHPDQDTGFLAFANGKLDGAIGWPQAVEYIKTLQAVRQPHLFTWGQVGHGARSTLPGAGSQQHTLNMDIRNDQSLPAFTRCSLDHDPGTGTPKTKAQRAQWEKDVRDKETDPDRRKRMSFDPYDGDPAGAVNRWLYWDTADIVDRPDRWEMTVMLMHGAPKNDCTVDITPRRCRKFTAKPDQTFTWTNVRKGRLSGAVGAAKPVQSGKVTADKHGLVTIKKIIVTTGKNRISIAK